MILSPKKKKEEKQPHPPFRNIIVVEIHCNKKTKNEFLNCSCLMGTSRVDCMSMNF